MDVKISHLPNGLTVISENIPHGKTITVAAGIKVGSLNETDNQEGLAHFLEHMLFKGTTTKDYMVLNKEIDDIGGYTNAYTSKTETVYYVSVLKEHIDKAFDFVSDIVFNSILPEEELEKEKGVVLAEIDRSEDSPFNVNFDRFMSAVYTGALGKPILGTPPKIRAYKVEDLKNFYDTYYVPENMVVSISGDICHEDVLEKAKQYFKTEKSNPEVSKDLENSEYAFTSDNVVSTKQGINQVSAIIGFKTKGKDELTIIDYMIMDLVDLYLTDGMSSKLFDEIREKRGLVYSISSYHYGFPKTGAYLITSGTSIENLEDYVNTLANTLKTSIYTLTEEEFQILKGRYKSARAFSSDGLKSRASANLCCYLAFDTVVHDDTFNTILDSLELSKFSNEYVSLFNQRPVSSILVGDNKTLPPVDMVPKAFAI